MRPARILVTLACGECKHRNYTTTRARKGTERLALRKFCKFCRRHTLHKEVK